MYLLGRDVIVQPPPCSPSAASELHLQGGLPVHSLKLIRETPDRTIYKFIQLQIGAEALPNFQIKYKQIKLNKPNRKNTLINKPKTNSMR